MVLGESKVQISTSFRFCFVLGSHLLGFSRHMFFYIVLGKEHVIATILRLATIHAKVIMYAPEIQVILQRTRGKKKHLK